MLKRLYVNNFRTLINTEMSFGAINLLLGPNGSGKSAIFDVLFKLRDFVTRDGRVPDLFPLSDFTCWQDFTAPVQNFELELEGNGGLYLYKLTIEYIPEKGLARMGSESLSFNHRPLFEFSSETGNAQLYGDTCEKGPEYPADWSRSGIGSLMERHDNKKLTWFKKRLENSFVIRLNPALMDAESRGEVTAPAPDLSDFASWFRYLSQERQGRVFKLTEKLRNDLEGFDSFKLETAGRAKIFSAGFRNLHGSINLFKLNDLSDGQRALIALYTLLYCLPEEECSLCIDEPENFLALPEIQPWLDILDHQTQNGQAQAILISHHPKIINFLANDAGFWIDREGIGGPARIRRIRSDEQEIGLPISELVERGWIFDA
ncbi:AAA family ATPase [Desulfobacterales bacterium HSG2]|nr:AAA family ATPase [Desulfobacterales bacterium HSG2]